MQTRMTDFNRFIIAGAVAIVVGKYTVVALGSFAHPDGHAAAHHAPNGASGISPENIARLERILAPSPKLDYSSRRNSEIASLVSYLAAPSAGGLTVPPIYLRDMPDFAGLALEERKASFIAFMLPLVLRANEELETRRAFIDEALRAGDMARLKQWAKLYGFDATGLSLDEIGAELRKRAAPVPVSIALAQAAVESGWGTSRFAMEGNALFGQRTTNRRIGIQARDADGTVFLRRFKSPFESVHFYMHNLNSNRAYADFRNLRGRMGTAIPAEHDVAGLVDTLVLYSERRSAYTEDIKEIIRINKLGQYDGATLADAS